MPSKTEEYLALAQRPANGLTRYWESWTDYLTTASSADFLVYRAALRSNAPVTRIFSPRSFRIAGRLSIPMAGLWKSTGSNLRKFLRRSASLFYTANAN